MATPDPAPATSNITVRRGDPLVVVSDVQKHYGQFHALKDIDLTVNRGEVVVVIGPSGSGKSTLCRTINRPGTARPPRRAHGLAVRQRGARTRAGGSRPRRPLAAPPHLRPRRVAQSRYGSERLPV